MSISLTNFRINMLDIFYVLLLTDKHTGEGSNYLRAIRRSLCTLTISEKMSREI